MCKDQLIRIIADRTGVKQVTIRLILEVFQDVTAESLMSGDKVVMSGFGIFELKSRNPRIGRNPHTGEPVEIPAQVLPSFSPSDALKERVSGQSLVKKHANKSPRNSPAK